MPGEVESGFECANFAGAPSSCWPRHIVWGLRVWGLGVRLCGFGVSGHGSVLGNWLSTYYLLWGRLCDGDTGVVAWNGAPGAWDSWDSGDAQSGRYL